MTQRRAAGRSDRAWAALTSASLIALAAVPTTAHAEASPDRDARIAALQAQLNRLQAEIDALRQQAPATPGTLALAAEPARGSTSAPPSGSSPAPSTAATADLGKTLTGGSGTPAAQRSRTFGPGIPTTAAVARIDAGHPIISTPDGSFTASLLGVMQFDVANYFQGSAGPLTTDLRRAGSATDSARARNLSDGSTFRRARIGIGGRAFGSFEYSVLFDFGGSGVEDNGHVQELWLQYSGWKPAHIRVGAFAPFIGLEDAGSTNGMMFLERPASADIARSLAGGDYREAGQFTIITPRLFASAALTGRLVNTGGSSTVQPYDSQLGMVGRAAALLVKNSDTIVHVGTHGSYVDHPANTAGPDAATGTALSPVQLRERPELRVDGTRLIDTGAIDANHAYSAGLEFAAQYRNVMIQGEYERLGIERRNSTLDDPHFHGFYVEGSWVITGQRRRYNDGNFAFDGPAISGSIDPARGNWGAWELALRYSDIDLNYRQGSQGTALPLGAVRGGDQQILTAGLNWYLNSIARIMFDYQHVDLRRLSPNATTYLTPVGAEIGQSYSTASMRFQLAF